MQHKVASKTRGEERGMVICDFAARKIREKERKEKKEKERKRKERKIKGKTKGTKRENIVSSQGERLATKERERERYCSYREGRRKRRSSHRA